MLFRSRLCIVCDDALRLAFENIQDRTSDQVPHHVTKESLIDSVLRRSCHLCRLIVYHLKLHWAALHREGVKDLKEEPTTLTEEDFVDSDFDFATYPSDRVIVRSYMLELPETLNLQVQISKYGDGSDGVFGIVKFDCDALNAETLKAAVPRFWIFDNRAFGTRPVTSRFNENTSAASCQSILKSWLTQCNDHDACKIQRQPFLPTRLLDLGDVSTNGIVRLVLSVNIDQPARYVTLSHCWGGSVPLQLREETKQNMIDGLDLKTFPKTFRDAIEVARWADVRYIWIDSCCIQQDSSSDWEKEAKVIQKVYKHTHFNISADHSENSHGGCFTDRLAYKMTPCPFVAPEIGEVFFLSQFDMTKPLTESPIATRAWVTQERFLSPRILHFTSDQLFWECAGTYACETFPHGVPHVYDNSTSWHYRAPVDLTQTDHQDKPKQYQVWGQICEEYSRSGLTYTSDKIIAFAGIAGEFQLRLPNDTYLAGLWEGDLTNGLLWKARAIDGWPIHANGSYDPDADPYITASMPPIYRAPSWSWLAKNCGIFWAKRKRYSPHDLIKIQDVAIEFANKMERTGDVNGGYLKIRGILRAAQWSQDGDIDSIVLDGKSGDQLLVSPEDAPSSQANSFSRRRTVTESFTIQRDTGRSFPAPDIFCLLVRISLAVSAEPSDIPLIEGLILGSTGETDQYERLGHFEAVGEGHARALLYELKDPARELMHPWEILDVENRPGGSYNEECFRKVEESVITIV